MSAGCDTVGMKTLLTAGKKIMDCDVTAQVNSGTQCDPGAARYNHTVLSVGYSTSAKEHLWAKCLSKGYVSGDNDGEDCCSFTELPRCILPRQGSNQQPVGHRQNQDDSNPYCSSVQEDTVTDAQRHTWEIVENPVL